MAGYISDGSSDFDDGMKWVRVPPDERLARKQPDHLVDDAGEEPFNLNVPIYKRVPLDAPRPAVNEIENGDIADFPERLGRLNLAAAGLARAEGPPPDVCSAD